MSRRIENLTEADLSELMATARELHRVELRSRADRLDTSKVIGQREMRSRVLSGRPGLTAQELADCLGTTLDALLGLTGDQVGQANGPSGPEPVYDPARADDLAAHPAVEAGRVRRVDVVTDAERVRRIAAIVEACLDWRIERITVTDFRTIKQTSFATSPLTVLTGRNAVGKTSLLDAVAAAFPTLSAGARWARDESPLRDLFPRSEHDAGAVNVDMTVRGASGPLGDDPLVAAAYCTIGLPHQLARSIFPVFATMLTNPRLVGGPGRWRVLIPAPARVGHPVAEGQPGSTDATDIVDTVLAAQGSGIKDALVPGLTLERPYVDVAAIRADPATVADDLFAQIPPLRATHSETPPISVTTPPEPRVVIGEPREVPGRQLGFTWLDADGNPAIPARATHFRYAWSDAEDSGSITAAVTDGLLSERLEDELVEFFFRYQDDVSPPGHAQFDGVVAALEQLYGQFGPQNAWYDNVQDPEYVRPPSQSSQLLAVLEAMVNRDMPRFLAEDNRVILGAASPLHDGTIDIWAVDAHGTKRGLAELSTGSARWLAFMLRYALVRLVDDWRHAPPVEAASAEADRNLRVAASSVLTELSGSSYEPRRNVRILIVDEPELHLHPAAVEEVARWLVDASRSADILVASHEPTFLQLSGDEASVVRVSRDDHGNTVAGPLDGDALQNLDALADELGLGRARLLHLVRGIVIVEGKADELVLRAFAGDIINRYRLEVMPLHGHTKHKALLEGDLATKIGMPLAVMFDETTQAAVDAYRADRSGTPVDEVRSLTRLLDLRDQGVSVHPIHFGGSDIIAAIPEATIARCYRDIGTWEEVESAYAERKEQAEEGDKAPSFKDFSLDRMQASRKNMGFPVIKRLVEERTADEPLPPRMIQIRKQLEAWASDPGQYEPDPDV